MFVVCVQVFGYFYFAASFSRHELDVFLSCCGMIYQVYTSIAGVVSEARIMQSQIFVLHATGELFYVSSGRHLVLVRVAMVCSPFLLSPPPTRLCDEIVFAFFGGGGPRTRWHRLSSLALLAVGSVPTFCSF